MCGHKQIYVVRGLLGIYKYKHNVIKQRTNISQTGQLPWHYIRASLHQKSAHYKRLQTDLT